MAEQYLSFPVTIYSQLTPVNQVLSKARCRIFYKGKNRNGGYITDEFAEKLIKTLPYVPIKGIYDNEDEDFTDHGESRDLGKIYGVVPETNNFAWEEHLDKDGVIRTYACTDVYLYTALYEEAKKIPSKGQSMELYGDSIKGNWAIKDGQKVYVYTDGCFLGLQALGDNTEPCFEGSAFFSLFQDFKNILSELEEVQSYTKKKEDITNMNKLTFKLSDGQKECALWELLNSNFNEENNWLVEYSICSVYDNYAVVREYETGKYMRVYYTKDDSNESVQIENKEECFIVDVNSEEKSALEALQAIKGTYTASLNEVETLRKESETLKAEKTEFEAKISELTDKNSTLETERENYSLQIDALKTEKEDINTQLETLKEYKLNVETQEKLDALKIYENSLKTEVIDAFKEKIDQYTLTELKKELAYSLVGENPETFSKNVVPRVPKEKEPDALTSILDKYKN